MRTPAAAPRTSESPCRLQYIQYTRTPIRNCVSKRVNQLVEDNEQIEILPVGHKHEDHITSFRRHSRGLAIGIAVDYWSLEATTHMWRGLCFLVTGSLAYCLFSHTWTPYSSYSRRVNQ